MGNTLIKGLNDNTINNSLLGKEISKIFTEEKKIYKSKNGDYELPINKVRACCLGVVKENPGTTEFITMNLPDVASESDATESIGQTKLGLQIKGDAETVCNFKLPSDQKMTFTKGTDSMCDQFMVNHCAKSLYDQGCLKCDKKEKGSDGFNKCTPKWDVTNKNCFTKNGTLVYGPEECVCINSQTGFTLNRNPSSTIVTNVYEKDNNPWSIKGSDNNDYTKYSLNLFEYDIAQQKPQVFDNRCSNRIDSGSAIAGKSIAYKLPDYQGTPSICMNMIKLGGNSSFGKTQLSNIKQTNSCGSGGGKPPDVWSNLEKEKDAVEEKCKSEGYDSCQDKENKINISKSVPVPKSAPVSSMKFSKIQISIMSGITILVIILLIVLLSSSKKNTKSN